MRSLPTQCFAAGNNGGAGCASDGIRATTALAPWCDRTPTDADTGGGIKGKHIDIFRGFGDTARKEACRVTAGNGTVFVSARAGS
ncbi:3D domain-containing protein [Burkholderia metallica]|uniref:3D domain-containing protein n=1 Tax=Burkholderia metallica TaxID=488729 RepID=UPI001583ACBF